VTGPDECNVNLQWKGTEACFDFYCPCGKSTDKGWPEDEERGVIQGHGHRDGFFQQEWQCEACGRWWHLPNRLFARPGKFFRDDGGYGCLDDEHCESGHR
jgi:hypothetical protein